MTTAAIDSQLQHYWPLLAKDEKQSILSVIKGFVKNKEVPPKRLTIEEYNRELKAAEARIDAGDFFTQEEVEKMAEEW